jgi:hypothetical protein
MIKLTRFWVKIICTIAFLTISHKSNILSAQVNGINMPNAGNDTSICAGEVLKLVGTQNSQGSWSSLSNYGLFNPSLTANGTATVDFSSYNLSIPTVYTFIYTIGVPVPISRDTTRITVNPRPAITLVENDSLCIDGTTKFLPSSGGIWSSSNQSIASISNSGLVYGVSPGVARFTFTSLDGCVSNPSAPITVVPPAIISGIQNQPLCQGDSLKLSASLPGTWESSNVSIASITNTGLVKLLNLGIANFTFKDALIGCVIKSPNQVINGKPILASTLSNIEVGQSTDIIANPTGTWKLVPQTPQPISFKVSPPMVTGVSKGIGLMEFTSNAHGCKDTLRINVIGEEPNKLTGIVFTDVNKNNIYDQGKDFPLPNVAIIDDNNNTVYFTNLVGYYSIKIDTGVNKVKYKINYGNWEKDSFVYNINVRNKTTFQFVGFVPSSINNNTKAAGNISSAPLECGQEGQIIAQAINTGSALLDGYLVVDFDPRAQLRETI